MRRELPLGGGSRFALRLCAWGRGAMKDGVDKPARPAKAGSGKGRKRDRAGEVSSFRKTKLLAKARSLLWKELPAITAALVEGTTAGSVTHLKLLMELGVLEKGMLEGEVTAAKEKSVEEVLMDRWRVDREGTAVEAEGETAS